MKTEYPRPQFRREQWLNLNGEWEFELDLNHVGEKEDWLHNHRFADRIIVPFAYQSKLSNVTNKTACEHVWYRKVFFLETLTERTILHFGAVDYIATVYVNKIQVGYHVGGHTSFSCDISNAVIEGENEIIVKVFDPLTDETIPRGKQFWKAKPEGIWYTNTTGIWQTVWLEQLNEQYLHRVKLTPQFDTQQLLIEPFVDNVSPDLYLRTIITFKGTMVSDTQVWLNDKGTKFSIDVLQRKIMNTNAHGNGWTWTPENPNLFDVTFELLKNNQIVDKVQSYFGMRKVHVENGKVYLNNRPYYQKLVLDQGYWPNSLMTAPNDEALIKDIELSKAMGFNGCRKHQKTEESRFYYHCDRLGYLVWEECAAPANFDFHTVTDTINEWAEIIERDYNHPSIIAWTPLNESWGVSEINYNHYQQHFAKAIYHYVKSQDITRLVIVNDGWEMLETDIIGIHNYNHGSSKEKEKYAKYLKELSSLDELLQATPANRNILVQGETYKGQPILLTEFGGIAYNPEAVSEDAWGYSNAQSPEEYLSDYERTIKAIEASTILNGFCYTQLTDVEQETNGLLTYDRNLKVPLEAIKSINDRVI